MEIFLIILMTSAITIAVVEDLRRMKIPNLVTFPTIVMALAYQSLAAGLNGFLFSAGGLAVGLGIFIVPYVLGGMGAGDVKLMGAIGAIVGAKGIIIASLLVILVGGGYGLVLYALNPRYTTALLKRLWMALQMFVFTRQLILMPPADDNKMPSLRYAVPIALGAGGYMIMKITGYDLFPELLGNHFQIFSIAMT